MYRQRSPEAIVSEFRYGLASGPCCQQGLGAIKPFLPSNHFRNSERETVSVLWIAHGIGARRCRRNHDAKPLRCPGINDNLGDFLFLVTPDFVHLRSIF